MRRRQHHTGALFEPVAVRHTAAELVALVAISFLAGCFRIIETGGDASTGEPSVAGTSTTGLLPTPADSSGPEVASSSTSTPAESTGTDDPSGIGFITDPDGGGHRLDECSVMEQDCPRGQKCNAWANDGGNAWNAANCFPVDANADAPGEVCTAEGNGVSGIDSCERGSICWAVDARSQEGECVPYCTGTQNAPTCEDPTRICNISGSGLLALCLPGCDPLDVASCSDGQSCVGLDVSFGCVPDASGRGGAAFESCEFINACDPGHSCTAATVVGACELETANCCTPFCDLSAPACPEPTTCVPYFEDGNATAGYEDVGVCVSE